MDTRLRGYDELGACAGMTTWERAHWLAGWRNNVVRKLVGWLWRQAGAHSRLPQSWLTIVVLTPVEVARPINREHAGQAPRTPGGPALVAA